MKTISAALLIVSSVVGAGFASGRELVAVFGDNGLSWWIVPIVGVLIGGVSYLFLRVGQVARQQGVNYNRAIFGRLSGVASVLSILNSFVILSVMIAGTGTVSAQLINNYFVVTIVVVVLAVWVVRYGIKGVLRVNNIVVPLTIAVLVIVGIIASAMYGDWGQSDKEILSGAVVLQSIVYVGLNIYLVAPVLHNLNSTKKQALYTAVLAAAILSVLVIMLVLALSSIPQSINYPMPILFIATMLGVGMSWIVSLTLLLCIFTSLVIALYNIVQWLSDIVHSRIAAGLLACSCAFLLSTLGFDTIVNVVYPIIGVFGTVYVLFCIVLMCRSRRLIGQGY